MKPTPHVTTVLIIAAFSTAGCSKSGDTSPIATPAAASAPAPQVLTPRVVLASNPSHEEAPAALPTPKIAGPVSFADGETAYQTGKYGDATELFEHYTGQRPGNAWGHYMLGLSAWKIGDLAKSQQAFEKALSIDPRHAKSLVNVSRVFIEQKRYDDALDRLTRAADLEPESAEMYRLLGRAQSAVGKTDEAIGAYRRAIELNERDAWSMNNLGLLFLETQRAAEALPLLVKATDLRPDLPAFHNNLGMALEHTGRFKAAATAYHAALAADPGHDKASRNLARVDAIQSVN